MAITTRETDGTGVTNKGAPLTNAEVDTNFIELQQNKVELDDLSVGAEGDPSGDGAVSYDNTTGVFTYTPPADISGAVTFAAKAGEALTKGDAVYVSGVSGNSPVVSKADADDASKMPAFGLAEADATNNAAVNVVTFGTLYGLDTSAFSAGDTVYVSTTAGDITATAPTGESSLLQNIGKVIRSHASAGSIKVGGAGRTNATPNLDDGNVFIGNASNQAEARALTGDDISGGTITSFASTGIDDNATSTAITIDSSQNVSLSGNLTVDSSITLEDLGYSQIQVAGGGSQLVLRADPTNTQILSSVVFEVDNATAGYFDSSGLNVTGDLTVDTNTLYVDSINNLVGIGKAPTVKLDVDVGNATPLSRFESSSTSLARQYMYGGAASTQVDVSFFQGTSLQGVFGIAPTTGDCFIDSRSSVGGNILFQRTGSTRMTITAGGNVGIGTSSPNYKLEVSTSADIGNNAEYTQTRMAFGRAATPCYITAFRESFSTNSSIVFHSNGNEGASPSEKMRIDSSGNVGIGTDAPAQALVVSRSTGNTYLDIARDTQSQGQVALKLSGGTGGTDWIMYQEQSSNDLRFYGNGSNRMILDSSGNVGIGDTAPSAKLEVNGGAADYTSSATGTGLFHVSGGASSEYAFYVGVADQGVQLGHNGGGTRFLSFETNETERMRIDSSGNLLVGATSGVDFKQKVVQSVNYGICTLQNTLSSGLNYDQFQVNVTHGASSSFHLARFYANATPQFAVRGDGVIYAQNTSVQSISDARVKENVRDSEQGIDVITALRPVRFDFKEGFGNDQKNQLGFIAQEVEAVFPDAVMTASEESDDEEPLKSLGPAALIPVMVKAIQEQQAMIETLQAQVAELQGA